MKSLRLKAVVLVVFFLTQTLSLMIAGTSLDANQTMEAPLTMTTDTDADSATLYLQSRSSALQMGNQSTIQILNHEVGTNDDQVNASQSLDLLAFLDPQFSTTATLNGQVSFAL